MRPAGTPRRSRYFKPKNKSSESLQRANIISDYATTDFFTERKQMDIFDQLPSSQQSCKKECKHTVLQYSHNLPMQQRRDTMSRWKSTASVNFLNNLLK